MILIGIVKSTKWELKIVKVPEIQYVANILFTSLELLKKRAAVLHKVIGVQISSEKNSWGIEPYEELGRPGDGILRMVISQEVQYLQQYAQWI